jgi:3-deoxy-D-manno-octulosonic-acid transferase
MRLLYSFSVFIYSKIILTASFFNNKARLWVNGRKNIFQILKSINPENKELIWFHCASLGEFEQGRPIIELTKQTNSDYFILVSFFSPSGYEIQKNFTSADFVCYLPIDTIKNATKFISIIKPSKAIFIKYEFWFNYLNELKKNNIPTYLASGIFRPSQHFFKFYGSWFRKQLQNFNFFFVQNRESEKLLKSIGLKNLKVSGDTRFDRVVKLPNEKFENKSIEYFCKDSTVIVLGSSWPTENRFLSKFIKKNKDSNLKFIIAPHEINIGEIRTTQDSIGSSCILLSELNFNHETSKLNTLIIDQIGILSMIYRFANIAIIGGGFGSGIHNTLEAAAYGCPVLFGPNYHKFEEAKTLISINAAFTFSDYKELDSKLSFLIENTSQREKSGLVAKQFINKNCGGTGLILNRILS